MRTSFHPGIDTAHDVRHIVVCKHCEQIGDDRYMVRPFPKGNLYHGRCLMERFGLAKLIELPKCESDKLALGDIGPKAMKAVIEARAASQLGDSHGA
jgi:hypothetical protein